MVQLQERKKSSLEQFSPQPKVVWELLPDDYILPDDPVESILQPLLAGALTEALDLAGLITATMLIATNMALTVKIDGKTVVKAPDWFFVPNVLPIEQGVIRKSYTPYREGEVPAIVMEFLSDTDGGEYSIRPYPPYGKMWFYEKIVKVPLYIIFEPTSGLLQVRQLNSEGNYEIQSLGEEGKFWLESLNLYLGVWHGKRLGETAYWLRWWDSDGNLLLWGSELIAQEKQRTEAEKQRTEAEKQRAEAEKQRSEAEKQRADEAELEITRLRQLLAQSNPEKSS
jgi:Uma2 family endonuclease